MTKGCPLVVRLFKLYGSDFYLSRACFRCLNIPPCSFSSATAVSAGRVSVWLVEFTTYAQLALSVKGRDWNSPAEICGKGMYRRAPFHADNRLLLLISVIQGTTSPDYSFYSRILSFYHAFSGVGLIPGHSLIQNLHLMDTIFMPILPYGCSCFYNIVLMPNFSVITP